MYRAAARFARDPEAVTPCYDLWQLEKPNGAVIAALEAGFAVAVTFSRHDPSPERVRWRWLAEAHSTETSQEATDVTTIDLIPPSPADIDGWLQAQIAVPEVKRRLAHAEAECWDFHVLVSHLPNLHPLVRVISAQTREEALGSVQQWITSTVIGYVRQLESGISDSHELQDIALHEFALGSPPDGLERWPLLRRIDDDLGALETWFTVGFTNDLLRDYFVARKIAREVEAGNTAVLLRYQFSPQIFLFLANLAPEVAAEVSRLSITRTNDAVREEVERRLHLTFAHLLNRPVGTIHAHLNEIRDALGPPQAAKLARHFERIRAEADYVHSLAERIRLWQTKPDEPIELVLLHPLVEDVIVPLRERYPGVAFVLDLDAEIQVHAMRDALKDVAQCLLENAFHAAVVGASRRTPQVQVTTRAVGATLRIEIRDSGPGVLAEDRERVFEPLVTTKKGGTGKPRGTGLGLSIAKRYAEAMGGRIGLDTEQIETCFFIDLVPGGRKYE